MLRLLTLQKYLPAMTVQEQGRFIRDGQPFTMSDIERWGRLLDEREKKINQRFRKAYEKTIINAAAGLDDNGLQQQTET